MNRFLWLLAAVLGTAPCAFAQDEPEPDAPDLELAAPDPQVVEAWTASEESVRTAERDLGAESDAFARIHDADCFEDARDALRVELAREHRLLPGGGHERHRGQVV